MILEDGKLVSYELWQVDLPRPMTLTFNLRRFISNSKPYDPYFHTCMRVIAYALLGRKCLRSCAYDADSCLEDRGQTDRVTVNATDCCTLQTPIPTLTLIYDLDFQSQASYGHDLCTCKNQGRRSVCSNWIELEQTDGRTRPTEVPSPLVRPVTVFV